MIQYRIVVRKRILTMTNRLMLRREAAEYSGTSPSYVTNQAKTGRLGYVLTSPRKMMFAKSDLDQWMASWRKVEGVAR
jgi:excisionase family DNA binding protein